MNKEKLLSCLNEISSHLGSNLFQIIDEDEMLECGAINHTQEELEEALDKTIEIIKPIIDVLER
tara:strand:- start:1758 stop:1949 length:192 start_codon:yes stop_codon:yes gene_type:complete